MKPLYKIISFSLLFFVQQLAFSQPITVVDGNTNPYTPENLITNVFLGDGVIVTDVQFFGDPLSVGYFSDALPTIGVDRGVVMSSGRVSSLNGGIGIDNPGGTFASYNSNDSVGDDDLDDILGNLSERDVCKYIISFIPTSDTLEFKYVWASEEYPEYACSSFNDVFGFFISGPGINGPYENNAENIALIPGTTTPVSINSIHPQNGSGCPPVNEEYYIDNNGSSVHPVYDGYTQVFTARAVVTPCQEYTIKLAIADAGDEIFDSGVFLEAKSFGTGTVDVALNTISLNGVVTESCADAEIVFSLEQAPEEDYVVDVNIFGSATDGVDYPSLPTEFIIPAGSNELVVPFTAFEDNVLEGEEFIAFEVQRDPCTLDTFYLYIRDNELPPLDLGPDIQICEIEGATLMGELPITLPDPPSFTNNQDLLIDPPNTILTSEIDVAGVLPVELGPDVIQSVCINVDHNWLSDLDIYLESPGGLFMELVTDVGSNGDDFVETCFVPGATLDIDYIDPPASGAPYTGSFNPEGLWSDLGYGTNTNGTWTLIIIDDAIGFEGTLLDWTITFNPEYDIFYSWSPAAGLDCTDCPNPVANPDVTTEYYLEVTDSYGCMRFDTILVEVVPALDAPDVTCVVTAPDCIEFSWNAVSGAIGYLVSIDGGPFLSPTGTLSHEVCGLNLNTEVSIEVIGVDLNCGGYPGFSSCTTPNCDGAIPTIEDIGGIQCFGDTTGYIEISATGTFPPFEFTLNGETNTTGDFYDLEAGIYTIDIIDGVNCVESYDFEVTQPDSLVASILEISGVNCFNSTDAELEGVVTGGTGTYTYTWSTGVPNGSMVTEVGAGLLGLDVMDENGCSASDATLLVNPAPLVTVIKSIPNVCNGGSTGRAIVTDVFGGTGPYSYSWNVVAIDTNLIENLPAGDYIVETSDANNCVVIDTITVGEPDPTLLEFTTTDVSCNGGATGTITVVPNPFDPFLPYQYDWDANVTNSSGNTASNLDVGTYSVTVTDIFGCSVEGSTEVQTEEEMLTQFTIEDPDCWNTSDGAISVEVSGGVYPYTYTWSDGGSIDSTRVDLVGGNYILTITDASLCEVIDTIALLTPDSIAIDLTANDPTCFGLTDGSVINATSGGTGLLTFDWGGGVITADLANVGAGDYTLVVIDENACQNTQSISLSEPDLLVVDLDKIDDSCDQIPDGELVANVSGGTEPYNYFWEGLAGNTDVQSGLNAGIYMVTVVDDNGCEVIETDTITSPDPLTIDLTLVDVTCFGGTDGSAEVVLLTGTAPLVYEWSDNSDLPNLSGLNQGSYSVTITDDNDCMVESTFDINQPGQISASFSTENPSCFDTTDGTAEATNVYYGGVTTDISVFDFNWLGTGQTGINATDLDGQTYYVEIIDGLGCTVLDSIILVSPAEMITNFTEVEPVSCLDFEDAIVEVNTILGTGPYTYQWDAAANNQTGPIASNLGAGLYEVTVIDDNGCEQVNEVEVSEPDGFAYDYTAEPVTCNGGTDGTATLFVTGSNASYTYDWGNQNGQVGTNLAAGIYEVTITDIGGCSFVAEVEIDQPEAILANASGEDVSCFSFDDGSIQIEATGGVGPYSYQITGYEVQTNNVFSLLPPASYGVSVIDANGCVLDLDQIEIIEPIALDIELGEDLFLENQTDFEIVPAIVFETPIASYQWELIGDGTLLDPMADFASVEGMDAQTAVYVTVVDENGCVDTDVVRVIMRRESIVLVPTGFSPNGDGNNDILFAHGSDHLRILSLSIFDRWGELLFQKGGDFALNDPELHWDGTFKGTDMPAGSYLWGIEILYPDGKVEVFEGSTSLIR